MGDFALARPRVGQQTLPARRRRTRSSPAVSPGIARPSLSHPLWLKRIIIGDLGRGVTLVTMAGGLFMVAALSAAMSGWLATYLRSPSFVLGSLGIAWVITAIRHRARLVDRLYTNLSDLFDVPRDEYVKMVENEFRRISDWRLHVAMSIPVIIVFLTAGWMAFYNFPTRLYGQQLLSLRPWVFDPSFYTGPSVFVKAAVLFVFAVMIAMCVGTAVWLVLREVFLVAELRTFAPVPMPEAVRSRLRPLADFHIKIASDWGLGAVGFLVLFWRTPDVFSIAILSALAGMCFFMFLIPQLLLSRIVRNSHERACGLAIALWWQSESNAKANGRRMDPDPEALSYLFSISARPKYWVYSTDELWRWMSAQVLAAGAVILQIVAHAKSH